MGNILAVHIHAANIHDISEYRSCNECPLNKKSLLKSGGFKKSIKDRRSHKKSARRILAGSSAYKF